MQVWCYTTRVESGQVRALIPGARDRSPDTIKPSGKQFIKMRHTIRTTMLTALASLALLPVAAAQEIVLDDVNTDNANFRIAPSSLLSQDAPLFSIERNLEQQDFQGSIVEDVLNFNLGVEISPLEGLNVRADAWRLEIDEAPAAGSLGPASAMPQLLYLEDSVINEFNLDNPLMGTNFDSSGFDLGASYVWETSRFGQFTLSTKATYVRDFENKGGLLELGSQELNAPADRMISPELQSSLMLSWEFGNHTASAITNYFDSFKEIGELDVDEINALLDNMTTVDLQYGYSVKTGSNDRAIISFGIRNIFDEKTAQILNSTTRILDQNGRVAYGSIKYQF